MALVACCVLLVDGSLLLADAPMGWVKKRLRYLRFCSLLLRRPRPAWRAAGLAGWGAAAAAAAATVVFYP